MTATIPYMGTKRQIAPTVATLVAGAPDGIFLDAFSGMCAVGNAVGTSRTVWNNDAQRFATLVAETFFTVTDELRPPEDLLMAIVDLFLENRRPLVQLHHRHLAAEAAAYRDGMGQLARYLAAAPPRSFAAPRGREINMLRAQPELLPARLFTTLYADTYLGLQQCIDLDSLAFGIRRAHADGLINEGEYGLMLVALGRSMLSIATTTGHFAQFLQPSSRNYSKFSAQRSRDLWQQFSTHLEGVQPLGTAQWRTANRAFNGDSLQLLLSLADAVEVPSVVYADPPYTEDQYSRYYHLWETLLLFDYPEVTGKGRYRPERFATPFSLKSRVVDAFGALAAGTAELGAELILSYPTNGLLFQTGANPHRILSRYFAEVEIIELSHEHSTLGASKGSAKASVTELLFCARQ